SRRATASSLKRRPRSVFPQRWSCSGSTTRACRIRQGMPDKGTVLAFDFGLKRIGVAVGEPELKTAHPLQAISKFEEIHSLVKEWRPARLVVGLPVRESGEHPLAKRVEKFARRLEGSFRLP